jgi:hypothetical protein
MTKHRLVPECAECDGTGILCQGCGMPSYGEGNAGYFCLQCDEVSDSKLCDGCNGSGFASGDNDDL